jgi:phage terminase Nu1 subunit (DNA packaging protein)
MPAAKKQKPPAREPWMDGDDVEADAPAFDSQAGIIVNKARLATMTGLSLATIDRAVRDGAPVVAKGKGWQINTAAFVAWFVRWQVDEQTGGSDTMNFDQAKARKMAAGAERVEMENDRREGKTVLIDDAVASYREDASVIRSQLMAIPGRVAIAAAAESDAVAVEALIQDEVTLALQTITESP